MDSGSLHVHVCAHITRQSYIYIYTYMYMCIYIYLYIYICFPPIRPHFLLISHKYYSSRRKTTGLGGDAALATDILQPRQRTPIAGRKFQQIQKIQGVQNEVQLPWRSFRCLGFFGFCCILDFGFLQCFGVVYVLSFVHCGIAK